MVHHLQFKGLYSLALQPQLLVPPPHWNLLDCSQFHLPPQPYASPLHQALSLGQFSPQIVTLDCGIMWSAKLRFRSAQVKFEKNHLHFLRIELKVEANIAEVMMPCKTGQK